MSQIDFTIRRFPSLESTNLKARELAASGAAHGTVVLAERQTAGRGRGSRVWHSPPGGLYFSVLLYPKKVTRPTDFALMAGTALAQAIKNLFPKATDITVKWPNDVLVNWKKVGGILSESLETHGYTAIILGVGVNVNVSASELTAFQKNPFPATSIKEELKSEFKTDEILDMFLKKLQQLYQAYSSEGFASIKYYWEKNCRMIGKRIELRDIAWSGGMDGEVGVTIGTMLGIDSEGALVLSNPKGERHQYVTGEITCFWP
jgi:BirA family transcriptional regulator, biotin operon repressor / biotin---[acetyl-CoA-carboxylase] ligase